MRKEKKAEWHFFWKNIGWFGMFLRAMTGTAALAAISSFSDNPRVQKVLAGVGAFFLFNGLLRWCPLRAILGKPTRSAYLRRCPDANA
ncbi:MAG: DUF2892 domain-containing protein [Actinomycetota bacterium]|nr:DUF2892 domain-containing protein [Actinomycetota bacterium]